MTRFILGLCLCFSLAYSYACDICGCAASSFSMGLLPNSQHHFIGLRSTFRYFESTQLHDVTTNRLSDELFTSTDLFGRYKLSKRFQLLAFVPYVHNSKTDSLGTIRVSGLGDITALANFVFVHNTDSLSRHFKHSGTIGFGVKMPTGNYFRPGFTEINMLPGSGSFDYVFNLNYSVQYRSFGLQNETSFTYKTENKYLYKFGDAITITQLFFYRWNVTENLKLIPQLGANFVHNWKDRKNGKLSEDTFNGGNLLNAQLNLLTLYKNWGFSPQLFIPVSQHLNGGYVKQKLMFRLSINYFINKK
ncbi:MAG: hypothetical protein K0R65_455 [Crocinitomicaceae bacterium]|jgi:hypothetical protein|nr:hypothetical protein [Crocinitomicaceae bacterium]